MTEPDYVTMLPTLDPHKFLVVVMHYHAPSDEFIQTKCSQPLPCVTAGALAKSWATALGVEVR